MDCDETPCDGIVLRLSARPLLSRHNHLLHPWLRIIAARAIVEDGDAEAAAAIAMRTPQPKLQIKDKRMEL